MSADSSSAPSIVLAIGAHPDDIEFQCAGTLALLKQRGWHIVLATMSPGDLGSATRSRGEISHIRRQEARDSAAVLGADYHCLESGDFAIFYGAELCQRVTSLVRAVRPDLVLTHPPHDYLADHEETSRIVRGACFAAPVRNYETGGAREFGRQGASAAPTPTDRIPHLYYWDPVEGLDIFGRPVAPGLIVDISSVMETKQRMLAAHASQRDWLRVQHGCDQYLDEMRRWSAARGRPAGCAYGEGFRQHLGHAYPRDDWLGSVLGSLVHPWEMAT